MCCLHKTRVVLPCALLSYLPRFVGGSLVWWLVATTRKWRQRGSVWRVPCASWNLRRRCAATDARVERKGWSRRGIGQDAPMTATAMKEEAMDAEPETKKTKVWQCVVWWSRVFFFHTAMLACLRASLSSYPFLLATNVSRITVVPDDKSGLGRHIYFSYSCVL